MLEKFYPGGEPFEHEADGHQVDEGFRSLDLQLVFFAQATISGQPRKRALHDPSQAHHLEGSWILVREGDNWKIRKYTYSEFATGKPGGGI